MLCVVKRHSPVPFVPAYQINGNVVQFFSAKSFFCPVKNPNILYVHPIASWVNDDKTLTYLKTTFKCLKIKLELRT